MMASLAVAHTFPSPECPGQLRGPGRGQRTDLSFVPHGTLLQETQVPAKVPPGVSLVWSGVLKPGGWAPEQLHALCRNHGSLVGSPFVGAAMPFFSRDQFLVWKEWGMNWGTQPRRPAPTGSSWEPSARVNSNSETSGCQEEPIIFLSFLHNDSVGAGGEGQGGWRKAT